MGNQFNVGDKVCMRMGFALPKYFPDITVIGEALEVREDMLLVEWNEDSCVLSKPEGLVDKDLVAKAEE